MIRTLLFLAMLALLFPLVAVGWAFHKLGPVKGGGG